MSKPLLDLHRQRTTQRPTVAGEDAWDVRRVARYLGLANYKRVYTLDIPRFRYGPKSYRWDPADVRAWRDTQRRGT